MKRNSSTQVRKDIKTGIWYQSFESKDGLCFGCANWEENSFGDCEEFGCNQKELGNSYLVIWKEIGRI